MIREILDEEVKRLEEYLNKDKFQNPYFYTDLLSFGYKSDNVQVYITDSQDGLCYIYRYYDTVQLYIPNGMTFSKKELIEFLEENKFQMISGSSKLINEISDDLSLSYCLNNGVIMGYGGDDVSISDEQICYATPQECPEIARLICSDEKIGGHYDVDKLANQLSNRLTSHNCRNVILSLNDKIISHAATYAEEKDMAIIGGVITLKDFRGCGYGKKCVVELVKCLLKENKVPLLFCYDDKTISWYKSMGWNIIAECGSLKKR